MDITLWKMTKSSEVRNCVVVPLIWKQVKSRIWCRRVWWTFCRFNVTLKLWTINQENIPWSKNRQHWNDGWTQQFGQIGGIDKKIVSADKLVLNFSSYQKINKKMTMKNRQSSETNSYKDEDCACCYLMSMTYLKSKWGIKMEIMEITDCGCFLIMRRREQTQIQVALFH